MCKCIFARYNASVLTSTLGNFHTQVTALLVIAALILITVPTPVAAQSESNALVFDTTSQIEMLRTRIAELQAQLSYLKYTDSTSLLLSTPSRTEVKKDIPTEVPFYSQFTDITKPGWQKIGCGIASVAMLIDYYTDTPINVDALLEKGIANDAYLTDAGWIHAGLIGLSREYGLDGTSQSLAHLSSRAALSKLKSVVAEGPVMVSVHYTFEPSNPIPHLVVINDIADGIVYYNDPAEQAGNGSLTYEQFKRGWKQRYIVIRPEHT